MAKKHITIIELRDKYSWRSGDIMKALHERGSDIYKPSICKWFNGTIPKQENIDLLNEAIAFMRVKVIFKKKS